MADGLPSSAQDRPGDQHGDRDLADPFFEIQLSPMIAAAAMALSSLSVVTNANRLRGWRRPEADDPADVSA